jgi:hypothetical protein
MRVDGLAHEARASSREISTLSWRVPKVRATRSDQGFSEYFWSTPPKVTEKVCRS